MAEKAKWYTVKQAANIFEVHRSTFTRWCQKGLIAHRKTPGGTYRVSQSAIDRWHNELVERAAVAD